MRLGASDAARCALLAAVLGASQGANASLLISEIMYNPASAEDDWEWLELYNGGASIVDPTGYVLDDIDSIAHLSSNIAGGSIAPASAAVLYNADDLSAADFSAAWGAGLNLIAVSNRGPWRSTTAQTRSGRGAASPATRATTRRTPTRYTA